MAFSSDYVQLVLNENFEDAKGRLLEPLLAIHDAHLVMLTEQGIVSRDDARTLAAALDRLDVDTIRTTRYDGTCEDLFFYVERLIAAQAGEDVAGRLHTARSRNDIDMTMYRMRLREDVRQIVEATLQLRHVLISLAMRHRDTVFPAHTHTQPAQPTTVAHYFHAVVEQLERDATRLFAAFASINQCPLGACAITGTGFPIDRRRTSTLLGFDAPTGNTYGSIATVDYLIEAASAAANLTVGCGRVVQDLLLWSTVEVGYLRLSDGFVQTSSIMPQKRNPVALEHARALLSKALGQLIGIVQAVHNTPFGDIVDTEDDLQPLVASAFKDAYRGVALVAAALRDAAFDAGRMAARAASDMVTVTELADTLTRERGVPFAAAHAVTAAAVRQCAGDVSRLPDVFFSAARAAGIAIDFSREQVEQMLSPAHFVRVRETYGGPGPTVITEGLARSLALLDRDQSHLDDLRQRLRDAVTQRRAAVMALAEH